LRFEVVAEQFLQRHNVRASTRADYRSFIDGDFVPAWRGRTLLEIGAGDVVEVLDRIEARASHVRANRGLAAVRKLFNWAVSERRLIDVSPAAGIGSRGKEIARDRYLSFAEIGRLMRACESLDAPFGHFVGVLLATGQRRGEVAGMQMADVDFGERLWTLKGEATKAGRKHTVPLSELTLELLRTVPTVEGSPLVFSTTGGTPISGFGKLKNRLDQRAEIDDWRLHDFAGRSARISGGCLVSRRTWSARC